MTGAGLPARRSIVVSTGRCGSTFLSTLASCVPGLVSLSEYLSPMQPLPDPAAVCTGRQAWALLTQPRRETNTLVRHHAEPAESIYPLDDEASRFNRQTGLPPISATTLPHLAGPSADQLLDELEGPVQRFPAQPVAAHLAAFADLLRTSFNGTALVERSGASSGYLGHLMGSGFMPDAELIHLYREPIACAQSMSRHSAYRLTMARYLQVAMFGEDWYADDVAGLRCAVAPQLARVIVGRIPLPPDISAALERLHPASFDVQTLWTIPLPLALFARYWSLMCASAEHLFRGRPVLHLSFDEALGERPHPALDALRTFWGADADVWGHAVTSHRRAVVARPTATVDQRVWREAAIGVAALRKMGADVGGLSPHAAVVAASAG